MMFWCAAVVAMAPAEGHEAQARDVLVLETVGFSRDEFASELQLRLPQRKLLSVESPRPARGFVYVHVTRVPPDVVRISIIEPDGRAYDRELPHEPNQEVRVAASAIATLLASVEHGELVPDREDVPIPGTETETTEKPGADPPEETSENVRSPAPPGPARFELGFDANGSIGLGLAPTTGAGVFVGAGGGVGAALRFRSGALITMNARALRRVADPLAVSRMRLSLGGGYGWRWSAFELRASAGVGVEPWWAREGGRNASVRYDGQPTNRRPLVGLVGVVAPGFVWRAEGDRLALSVGPRVGIAGSFVLHDGARTVRLDRASGGQPAARLGGLELELGLGMTVWIPIRTNSRSR